MSKKIQIGLLGGGCLLVYLGFCLPLLPVADARAADLLRQMVSEGLRTDAARRLLTAHFEERVE